MFRPNQQMELDSNVMRMDDRKLKRYNDSWELMFYKHIFNNIDEEDFHVLYSDKASRPNSPINCMVGALIMMTAFEWTYEELFDNLDFHILTRAALGITDLDVTPFTVVTLFGFRNRVMEHSIKTGEDLFEKVFKKITQKQLEEFKIKGNIQRADTFMVASNIKRYGRIELLVEVMRRFHDILSDHDRELFADKFAPYLKYRTSGHFVYNLEKAQIPHELEKLGCLYKAMLEDYKENYSKAYEYEILQRVYNEHFNDSANGVKVKESTELKSGSVQSPDDIEATYRKKNDKDYRGRLIGIVETANPKNAVNIITDVVSAANNKDDGDVLNGRIEKIKEITPEINEMHTDGAFGNSSNDEEFSRLGIMHVQTAIKGRTCERIIEIKQQRGRDSYCVSCPQQSVKALKHGEKFKAEFVYANCAGCRHIEKCPAKEQKEVRAYYFDRKEYLKQKRIGNIDRIKEWKKKLRPNVEATVHEYRAMMTDGKLKVRGNFKTSLFAYLGAICINLGRIYRYKMEIKGNISPIIDMFFDFIRKITEYFFKEQFWPCPSTRMLKMAWVY